MAADIDTLRVLIATDCHVGYLESDEVRRYDSFNAFEEICSIASQRQVDFLLLGGDLFHENKPSRSTLVRTIEILRKYCMNDKPIRFQVVSDQTINFANKFGLVNYEDPNFNVGLPVFTIHGNHDDPAGVDNLSAIDILAATNLVNYFGKVALGGSGVGNITLHPILLRKGSTNVALYGLGNIRDERLNRMFQTPHAVQWIRPEGTEECPTADWFNIFVLHQNRVKANPKNAINEHMLAKFLDFVIWGHEHECLVEPQEVLGMDFHITQPGSSVATSLIDGESKAKHVLLLEIKGNQYRPTKIPLKSVRPFKYKNVSLQDAADLDANDVTAVLEYLGKLVHDLIAEAAAEDVRPDPILPLVRLRVDYTGFTTINPQRFGQKFVGKVANPHDILLFTKAPKKRINAEGKIEEEEKLRPEELNQQNIEALLAETNLTMEILPVSELGLALHKFVTKDDKLAFTDCLQENLDDTQSKLVEEALSDKLQEDDVIVKVAEHMQQREKSSIPTYKEASSSAPSSDHLSGLEQRTSQAGTSRFDDDDVAFGEDDDRETVTAAGKRKAPAKRAAPKDTASPRGRGRGRGRGRSSQGGLTQTTLNVVAAPRPPRRPAASSRTKVVSDDEDSEPDEDSDEEIEEPAPKVTRTSTKASPRGRKNASSASKRGAGSSARGARNTYIEDDVEDDDDDDDAAPKKPTPTPPSQKRSSWGSLR